MRRRQFVALAAASVAAAARAGTAGAQPGAPAQVPNAPSPNAPPAGGEPPVESPTPNQVTGAAVTDPEVSGATMEGEGYRPVRRAAKPGARPSMSADQRDALEHQLSCPCPCTLDVYTCRTSMSCGFSPAIHRDVMSLVEGGYSADEILGAFTTEYGEQILMAPVKSGFNWAGYIAPFAAIGGGAVVLAAMMRRWSRRAAAVAATERAGHAARASGNGHAARGRAAGAAAADAYTADATPAELAELEAAVRGGEGR